MHSAQIHFNGIKLEFPLDFKTISFMIFWGIVFIIVFVIILTPICLLCGRRPNFTKAAVSPDKPEPFIRYNLPMIFGKRIWPIFMLLAIAIAICLIHLAV